MNERRDGREGNGRLASRRAADRKAASDLGLAQTIIVRGFVDGQQVFERYMLRKELGRGAMGVVWLAWDDKLEREVALKFLPEMVRADPGAIDELKRETRRSLQLTHPNIVRVYDFLEDDSSAAIAMEYIDGSTLSALRVQREGRCFDVEEIQAWVKDLCAALHFAHSDAKVVHRDLKPANLMVDRSGRLKVTDFGIARSISDSVSRVSVCVFTSTSGSLAYMSPQQAIGGPPLASDDVYSIGATIYELLTGKPPFYSGNVVLQLTEKNPPRMAERRAELGFTGGKIPAEWEETVAACLAKTPEQRPTSVAEIWQRLDSDQSRRSPVLPRKPFRFAYRTALVLGGTLALLAGWSAWRLHNEQLARVVEVQSESAEAQSEEIARKQEEQKVESRTQAAKAQAEELARKQEEQGQRKAEAEAQAAKVQAEELARKQEQEGQRKAEAEAQAAKAQAEELARKQEQEGQRKAEAEAQAAKAQAEELARKQEQEGQRKAEAEAQATKVQAEEVARKQQEERDREQKAEAYARAAKAQAEEIERRQEEAQRQQRLEKERQLQDAQRFAAAKAELLASQEKLLQISIASASWEAADDLSAKLLEGGLPADRLGGYLRAIAKGRMEEELQRKRKESSPPDLPASGFFDLDAVFATGPYAAYNRPSKQKIFKAAQDRLKANNLYQMEADGRPGAETEKALIAFQREKGIPVSGRLDPPTVEALGLVGRQETEAAKLTPAPEKKSKPRPKSSQTSPPRIAKASPPPVRASSSSRPEKQAPAPSQPSPPSPVDVILDQ